MSVSHLAAREDATTEGTFVVEETADEIFVVRHFHSVHHVLQRVVDIWLLKQRDDELAAPPAGQVVQRQQTPAHPLHRSTPGEQGVNAAAQVKPHREVPFNYIKTTFPCQHRCARNKPSGYFPCSLTCLSGLLGSIGGSGWSVQMRWWKGSRRGRCSRDRAPFTSPPLSRRASSH